MWLVKDVSRSRCTTPPVLKYSPQSKQPTIARAYFLMLPIIASLPLAACLQRELGQQDFA